MYPLVCFYWDVIGDNRSCISLVVIIDGESKLVFYAVWDFDKEYDLENEKWSEWDEIIYFLLKVLPF